MPFVKFHLSDTISDESRDAICAATQAALVRSLGVPVQDLFQTVRRHGAGAWLAGTAAASRRAR